MREAGKEIKKLCRSSVRDAFAFESDYWHLVRTSHFPLNWLSYTTVFGSSYFCKVSGPGGDIEIYCDLGGKK